MVLDSNFTTECRNTYYLDLYCKYGALVKKYTDALAYNKKTIPCLERDTKLLYMYLQTIKCYTAIPANITSAVQITFNYPVGVPYTVTINQGLTVLASYSGNGGAEDMVNYFYSAFLSSPIWVPVIAAPNVLIIYSTDPSVSSITDILGYTVTKTSDPFLGSIEHIEDNTSIIFDSQNCITLNELEKILKHAYRIIDRSVSNTTSNCGC